LPSRCAARPFTRGRVQSALAAPHLRRLGHWRHRETQEMLTFCGEQGIVPEVEMIHIDYINEAYERLLKQEVKYRFVIDPASLQRLNAFKNHSVRILFRSV
jgi:hypothetical protein